MISARKKYQYYVKFHCGVVSKCWSPVNKVRSEKTETVAAGQSIVGYTSTQSHLATRTRNRLKRVRRFGSHFEFAST